MSKIDKIIEIYDDKLKNLIEEYKKAYTHIRLEHDLYHMKMGNNSLNREEKNKIEKVKTIEKDIQNIFVKILNEVGIGSINNEGINAANKVEKSKHDTNAFKTEVDKQHYVENAAIEREKILQFRVLREKIFFGLFLMCFGLSIYVVFRDIESVSGGGKGKDDNTNDNKKKKSIFDLPKPPMPKQQVEKPKQSEKPEVPKELNEAANTNPLNEGNSDALKNQDIGENMETSNE